MLVFPLPRKTEEVSRDLKALVNPKLKRPHVYVEPFRIFNPYNKALHLYLQTAGSPFLNILLTQSVL